MRKPLFLFFLISIYFVSCKKEDPVEEGAKTTAEAELRLAAVDYWVISDVKYNGEYVVKDKKVLDPSGDFNDLVEWIKFNVDSKTVETKFASEDVTNLYDYTIEGDIFKVISKDADGVYEEIMTIKSGSVFSDHFVFEQIFEDETLEVKLVPRN